MIESESRDEAMPCNTCDLCPYAAVKLWVM